MGGKNGLEVRASSMRVKFTVDGVRHAETLMLNGEPMAPTPANLKYAARLAAEIRQKIAHGTFSLVETFPASGKGPGLTVADHLQTWLDSQRLEESTRRGYNSIRKFWAGQIGHIALRSLKVSDILKALATHPEWSGKTVNNKVDVLSCALDLAVLDNAIAANPAKHVPRASHQPAEPDPFTLEEVDLILDHLRAHADEQVVNYVEWKFFSGVRTGESLGLRWGAVDWPAQRMLVSESVVCQVHKKTTKTSRARLVALNSRALAALTRQKKHTYLAGDYVFHDPRSNAPWATENAFCKGYWLRALKATGVRYRPPYNTRHTYATMLLMAGARPAYVAKQMGHSVDVLLKNYARWLDDGHDDIEQRRLESFIAIVPGASPGKSKSL
ncbi:XerC Integrase [uncultured Caudovirales phage]|uniref:Integrase n=1 Tax=uncultured Caudovirales phage TaxID=2100421 RepID=A0A6J5L231_9CAUD|nr:XerC Integrase [uncultured Caudovirales phage]CAB5194973.1 XerC Integrase [uncultured Caudovirales phage]